MLHPHYSLDSSPSPQNFPDVPTSRSTGTTAREPSWITFHEPELVSRPKGRKTTNNGVLKMLCFPLKPFLKANRARNMHEMEVAPHPPPESHILDPIEAWKTKVRLLEAEIERLNNKYCELSHEYSRVHTYTRDAEKRRAEAENKFFQLRDAVEDMSKVLCEKYGREDFRRLLEKIEESKRRAEKRHGMLVPTTGMTRDADTRDEFSDEF